jgi:hypothetical protein
MLQLRSLSCPRSLPQPANCAPFLPVPRANREFS